MMENSDPNSDYALRMMQHPQLRETEEFHQWLSVPENKALFLDLMACKEALLREKSERKRRVRARIYMGAAAFAAAAVFVLVFLIPSLFPTASRQMEQPVRLFAAITDGEHVILQTDGHREQLVEDSVMNLKEVKAFPMDTLCCQTLTTPRGKSFQLVLSDGTKVWINTESSLRYPVAFKGKERRVELKGEACFEVAKNEKCPFIVSSEGMETKVLGTTFNIRSYKTEDRHVTLVQGKVEVTNTASHESVMLRPGQDLTYTETGEENISRVNVAVYTAWTEGMFYFEDASLKDIMRSLGRWYNVNIDFEQAELCHIRLNFWANRDARLEETLELLNKLEKVHVDYQDDTITIKHI